MLTLEEAIKAEEAEAIAYEECLNSLDENMPTDMWNELNKSLGKQMDYHRQLAEWLRELKAYKKAYTEIDSKIESDYMGNNEYEMAVSDGYQSAINIIDRCIEEVNADGK